MSNWWDSAPLADQPANDSWWKMAPRADGTQAPMVAPGPRTSTMPQQPIPLRPWGDVAMDFMSNLPRSVWNDVIKPTYSAITERPGETAANVVKMMAGLPELLPQPRTTPEKEAEYRARRPQSAAARDEAKAVAQAVVDDFTAYADPNVLQDRLANQPGRVMMDVSSVLPIAGTPGRMATQVLDPVTLAGNVVKQPITRLAEPIAAQGVGLTTGMGARSVRDIGEAGRSLGSGIDMADGFIPKTGQVVENAAAVVDNMNKGAPVQNVVSRAQGALQQARNDRNAAYKAGMKDVEESNRVIPFDSIQAAVDSASEVANFKGVELNPSAASTKGTISSMVQDWKTLNPDSPLFENVPKGDLTPENFHTAVGLDALKRLVGDTVAAADQGTPARVAAERVYAAIGAEIRKAAPEYAKVMADYQSASGKLGEATRTFSLGERATGDTAARKLLSATRDSVATNFGGRAQLLDELAKYDPSLPYAIAGQSAQSVLPRGLVARGSLAAGAGGTGYGLLSGAMLSNPYLIPGAVAGAMAASPRVVGNIVYYGGRAIGTVDDVLDAARINPSTIRAGERGGYQAAHNDETAQRALELYRQRQAVQGNPYLQGAP